MNQHLKRQLNELVDASVIQQATANDIEAYYTAKHAEKPNRLFTVFGVLGALLSGLGIILIIAHNWDGMGKTLKCVLAFMPLLLGQALCAYATIKNKGNTWKESSSIFLLLSVGATISLVSQIYHIPGDISDFLLVWIFVTAPVMYLFRSNAAVIFHLVLSTYYACEIGYDFKGISPWWYWVFLAWMVPFYINSLKKGGQAHLIGVLNWLLPLSLTLVLGAFAKETGLSILLYLGLFGLFYNIGQLPHFKKQKLRRNGYAALGSLGTVLLLILMTFEWYWKEAKLETEHGQTIIITLVIHTTALGILAYNLRNHYAQRYQLLQYAFLIIGVLYLTAILGDVLQMILTNILVAAIGLKTVYKGINKANYAILNYGLLIISTIIICRFFDTNIDFILRGTLFIAIGMGFFFTNFLLLKKQQRNKLTLNPKKEDNV
ncbi:Hypothetical protein I595_1619 [Croceitalea dokdonensis DOKDO 023]|uniref:DUF2157 domain-containing protein n=1 Tax=Croceitalea dokdonensis DOKDO 023 TaxID=1300341 RepID=A0A0P7AU32_9FLAO|nr:DUF2157 domain-containing protein [Croceitalea dokdonensis]KPM31971.1 Hypothetical protein I595_1619 [Croceitalea dokdonensis DOKDO 023]